MCKADATSVAEKSRPKTALPAEGPSIRLRSRVNGAPRWYSE
jgi:hypothetical protein